MNHLLLWNEVRHTQYALDDLRSFEANHPQCKLSMAIEGLSKVAHLGENIVFCVIQIHAQYR